MAKITIVFGALLIVLGVGTYLAADAGHKSPTALIPSFVGLIIAICGGVALSLNARKHAMHIAAMFGTLGFLAAAGRIVSTVIKKGALPEGLALIGMGGMAILCGVFVALCVQSFIAARKARG